MRKIGDLLREYIEEMGWPLEDPYSPIFQDWPSVAGKDFSQHSRPIDVSDGVLLVEVDHPGWLQMFLLKKPELLEAARKTAPKAALSGMRARLQEGKRNTTLPFTKENC
jgi:predicted nucleic acid-binding Zn ribbon protein